MSKSLHVNVSITQDDEGEVRLSIVGAEPYVLIRVADLQDSEEETRLDLELETGGGLTPSEDPAELAAFLRRIADFIDAGAEDDDATEDDEAAG